MAEDIHTAGLVGRMKKLRELTGMSEAALLREAGYNRTNVAAARARGGSLAWDLVASLALVLKRKNVSLEWFLWGKGPPMRVGQPVRLGSAAKDMTARPITVERKSRHKGQRPADAGPGAAGEDRRNKGSLRP